MEQLAQFRIISKIGAGGMGEVYRARDETLQRDVAIKLVAKDHTIDAGAHARLLREARSAAALSHPNICVVHEVGEYEGQAYIAMECVEGESLSARVARASLSMPEVVRFAIQLADALAHAHSRGVVHRDLKPANIIVTPEQRVKVLDFGLAHRFSALTNATTSTTDLGTADGVIKGTPAYMAPEQLRGNGADARSDIWALGVIVHEMISRKRPFEGNTWPELGAAILSSPPEPLPAGVPVELATIVGRCLEKEPSRRYQSASEVRCALELIESAIISSRSLRRTGERRLWRSAASAAVVVLIGGAAFLWMQDSTRLNSSPAAMVGVSPQSVAPKAIAVLPFSTVSSGDGEYLADGIQDALIGELSRVKELRVVSRTSTLRYRKPGSSAAEIARTLRVENLVEGTVTQAGNQVRIHVALLRAIPEERQVWSQVYVRDMRDIFALYGEIARTIAQQVDARLVLSTEATPRVSRNVDPELYKLYLRGKHQLNKGGAEGFDNGMRLLRQAVEIDPADPLPYAGMAQGWAARVHDGLGTHEELELARAAAEKAVRLDPNLPDAYGALATINLYDDWNMSSAEQNFLRALELNPSLAEVRRHYAWFLRSQKRNDEAVAEMKRARDAEPLGGVYHADYAWLLLGLGRWEEALAIAKVGGELSPENPAVLVPLGYLYLRNGMTDQAIEVHRRAVALDPSPFSQCALSRSLAAAGKVAEVRSLIELMKKDSSPWGTYGLAVAYTALGEKEEALRLVEMLPPKRFIWTPWLSLGDELAPLVGEPELEKIRASLGLP